MSYTFWYAVSCKTTLQSTIVLSTTKAEYMALTKAMKETIWLKGFVGDLGSQQEAIVVFISKIISRGDIMVSKVSWLSEMMTKLVSIHKFKQVDLFSIEVCDFGP